MIEQGIVALIQSGTANLAQGGFAVKLPENFITETNRLAWTYHGITSNPTYVMNGQDPFTRWVVQIDCHGFTMADAMRMARAIDGVFVGGYSGTLSDPDHTYVYGVFNQGPNVDGFNDLTRSYVRSLEYEIQYRATA